MKFHPTARGLLGKKLGEFMLMADIDVPQVIAVLKPIWQTKTETASRVRGRIESVRSSGEPPGPPIDDMPAFMRALRHQLGAGARALEFLME